MEIIFRGKHSFDDCDSKEELIKRCYEIKARFATLPDDVRVHNEGDDYILFTAEPKDKDDRKYLKRLGFQREEPDEAMKMTKEDWKKMNEN